MRQRAPSTDCAGAFAQAARWWAARASRRFCPPRVFPLRAAPASLTPRRPRSGAPPPARAPHRALARRSGGCALKKLVAAPAARERPLCAPVCVEASRRVAKSHLRGQPPERERARPPPRLGPSRLAGGFLSTSPAPHIGAETGQFRWGRPPASCGLNSLRGPPGMLPRNSCGPASLIAHVALMRPADVFGLST